MKFRDIVDLSSIEKEQILKEIRNVLTNIPSSIERLLNDLEEEGIESQEIIGVDLLEWEEFKNRLVVEFYNYDNYFEEKYGNMGNKIEIINEIRDDLVSYWNDELIEIKYKYNLSCKCIDELLNDPGLF